MVTTESDDARLAFSRRLNEALDDKGVPPKHQGRQTAAANLFGITQKGARKWLEGEAIPSTARWPDVASKAEVNISWLFFGEGEKRGSPNGLSANAVRVALAWQQRSAEAQQVIADALRIVLEPDQANKPASQVGKVLDAEKKKAMKRLDDTKPKRRQIKHR